MMKPNNYQIEQQPSIVKFSQSTRNGIQSHFFQRYAIGYVVRGKKYIHYGDVRHEVNKGDIFYFEVGHHYTEDIPEAGKTFEQIVFYYDTKSLNKILNQLSVVYEFSIDNNHVCPNCDKHADVTIQATNTLKNFFSTINQYIKDDVFSNDNTAENIKMTELIYLLVSNNSSCIKSKILGNMDSLTVNFEKIVQDNIFKDVSVEQLASMCNKSLTSFKKEFKILFFESPHKWFVKQRLKYSRLLLVSTNKSISEIGIECNFPNTSHFIKLFKKEFAMTPVAYRHKSKPSTYKVVPQKKISGTNFALSTT